MKLCTVCNTEKELTEFNSKGSGRVQSKCRDCQKKWYKAYYTSSPKEKERLAVRRELDRSQIYAFIQSAKNVPCMDCKKRYPYYVMDFDHIGDKKFNIGESVSSKSLRQIKDEINKCEVVCSNCHRVRTYNRKMAAKE